MSQAETRPIDGRAAEALPAAPPRLVVAEFVFHAEGEPQFRRHLQRTLDEARATEGCFGEYLLDADHDRARKCPSCGRWTKERPGWHEARPSGCAHCSAAFAIPIDE